MIEVAVGSPQDMVPGWADMRATCEEVAVGFSPALVTGWADIRATCKACLGEVLHLCSDGHQGSGQGL